MFVKSLRQSTGYHIRNSEGCVIAHLPNADGLIDLPVEFAEYLIKIGHAEYAGGGEVTPPVKPKLTPVERMRKARAARKVK